MSGVHGQHGASNETASPHGQHGVSNETSSPHVQHAQKHVRMGVITPITNAATGAELSGIGYKQVVCATLLAMSHINTRSAAVIPDLAQRLDSIASVNTTIYDSSLSPAVGIQAYRSSLRDQNHALVGAWDSSVSQIVATSGSVDETPQCSFASGSEELADKTRYPYFSRTVPSDAMSTDVLPRMIRAFGWRSMALIHCALAAPARRWRRTCR